MQEDNADKLGTDKFEVSWHGTARPEHQEWQGKVYTKEQLASVCGLGSVTGLLGANCRHTYFPFIEGVSERIYTDEQLRAMNERENEPKYYNGKPYTSYEATQRQRYLETSMRAQRQKIKLLEEAGVDEQDITLAKCKYRRLSQEYTAFSKQMGLPQERDRIYADGLGRVDVKLPKEKQSVTKYSEKLSEREVRKSGNDSFFEKMADITSNDWSETRPRVIDKETKKEIIEYAKSKNVNIVDLSEFDGDPELLKEIVDTLSKWEEILPTKKGITLRPSALAINDFGMARGRTIYIQNLALRDREIALQNINGDKGYFASTNVCDIAAHEYGHVFSKEKGINTIEISKEAYYNINAIVPTEKELFDYFNKNVSYYSSSLGKSELLAEIFAKHNCNADKYTTEIINLLKKKVSL